MTKRIPGKNRDSLKAWRKLIWNARLARLPSVKTWKSLKTSLTKNFPTTNNL